MKKKGKGGDIILIFLILLGLSILYVMMLGLLFSFYDSGDSQKKISEQFCEEEEIIYSKDNFKLLYLISNVPFGSNEKYDYFCYTFNGSHSIWQGKLNTIHID